MTCMLRHRWKSRPNELGCYGMGLETFEMQQCVRCGTWRDRVKDSLGWHSTERVSVAPEMLEQVGNYQLVAHRMTRRMYRAVSEFAADNGFEVVDARWRRWDRNWLIISALFFVMSGSWLFLLIGMACGWDWVHSYPRRS
jgi:hypothetical protein